MWRLVFTILGLVTAILFMTLGFLKTALILLCCGVGFSIGTYKDKDVDLSKLLQFWRNKWQ